MNFRKFQLKKLRDSESNGSYSYHDPIKFLKKSIESSLCDYSDVYISVTGNFAVTRTNAAAGDNPIQRNQPLTAVTKAVFKNCVPFKNCRTEINDTFVGEADFINIANPMYNLIKYSDNYSGTSGSLWCFKRYEVANNADVTNDNNAPLFRYKADLITNTEADGTRNGVKIAPPLKYLSTFQRSLEMPSINCKAELSLRWIDNCLLIIAAIGADANATVTDSPVVTLSNRRQCKISKTIKRRI